MKCLHMVTNMPDQSCLDKIFKMVLIGVQLLVSVSAMPIGQPKVAEPFKVLSRHARSTNETTSSGSTGIVAFFEDNNNKAMYLVLPLIVLVYGGCSAIYCVAKCRRYIRKRNRQKKHQKEELSKKQLPSDQRTNPENNGIKNPSPETMTEEIGSSRPESQNSVPGQIIEHDDKVPLVTSTARKHTPPPSLQDDRMSPSKTPSNNRASRRSNKTPGSIEMDDLQSRNSDQASMASRAALFTVSNTRRNSNKTNRDTVTPSTSRQDVAWPGTHQAPRRPDDDPKAGFKAMLQGPNYNPLYSHNADPWDSMRAMDRKAMGQSDNSAPWANQIKYDEFGRPKPQKKQRLIFVA